MVTPRNLAGLAVGLLLSVGASGEARSAQLLMLERQGCIWCDRFDAEIAPAYPHTAEGQRAPLRRVDVGGAWPDDLTGIAPERLTPTFVLMSDDGVEVARLRGYPGDQFFWPLLDEMLAKLAPSPGVKTD